MRTRAISTIDACFVLGRSIPCGTGLTLCETYNTDFLRQITRYHPLVLPSSWLGSCLGSGSFDPHSILCQDAIQGNQTHWTFLAKRPRILLWHVRVPLLIRRTFCTWSHQMGYSLDYCQAHTWHKRFAFWGVVSFCQSQREYGTTNLIAWPWQGAGCVILIGATNNSKYISGSAIVRYFNRLS